MAAAKLGGDVKASFWLAVVLIAGAALVDSGPLAWMLSPFILLLLIYAAARAPLRHSILVLMFCACVLENPNDNPGDGRWTSPFFGVGRAMLGHLNNLTGVSWLSFSGQDLMVGVLIMVTTFRKWSGSPTDRAGRIRGPAILVRLAHVAMIGVVYVWIVGLVRGGDFGKSLWQVEKVIYLPVMFLLCEKGFRGPKDLHALGKVVLTAAVLRSFQAIYVYNIVTLKPGEEFGFATSHHDSILFASAFVMLILLVLERAGPKYTRAALLYLPILAVGMWVNHRRMVWVQVVMVLLTLYFATPESKLKRKARRIVYVLAPFVAVYIAVGWGSQAGIFAPVQTMRSVVEPETDASALWREIETYNIVSTLRQFPILGYGYGNAFWEIISLPPVAYPLELFLPHNSLMGLWCFSGLIGYSTITLQWAGAVYFGWRSFFATKVPVERVVSIMAVGSVMIYMVQCFGDIGLGAWPGVYIMATTMSMAGKLTVANGAWVKPRQAPATGEPKAPEVFEAPPEPRASSGAA